MLNAAVVNRSASAPCGADASSPFDWAALTHSSSAYQLNASVPRSNNSQLIVATRSRQSRVRSSSTARSVAAARLGHSRPNTAPTVPQALRHRDSCNSRAAAGSWTSPRAVSASRVRFCTRPTTSSAGLRASRRASPVEAASTDSTNTASSGISPRCPPARALRTVSFTTNRVRTGASSVSNSR